ncbi:MAG TPA: N-acetylmuramoyl-L-alanine amidase-like domain-containing protein [Saprospiraceae bacterium]|nr:N-acetylmuramoyl-L-alanine amidase-like domain-containing protein [Saprospiraceae bacterium]
MKQLKRIGLFGLLLPCLWFFQSGSTSSLPDQHTRPGAEVCMTDKDSIAFLNKQKIAQAEGTLNARTLAVAKSFLGTPYVHGCLDRQAEECLAVNLGELDCWTFMENSLAIALAKDGNFQTYLQQLQELRYWGGYVNGYGSRIHYFSGWLLQNEKRGLLKDLTREMGGSPYKKEIGYISARPAKYPKIKNPDNLRALKSAEKRINAHNWYYIPQEQVAQMEHLIQEGDIISLTAWKKDLDISHQGFAVKINGRIHLMHASSLNKKVIISKQPLPAYILSQPGQTGIMVARLVD